jgi:hypothetical protein
MAAGRPWSRIVADIGVIAGFLGLLCLPGLRNLLGPKPAENSAENRPLAPMPPLSLSRPVLEAFPARFEDFYNDHFGGRGTLLTWLNTARVRWLNLSSSSQVCIGKNGWLFYTHEPVGSDYDTTRLFRPDELLRWQRMLEARRDWLAARGVPYLFVVAPDKQSIYPEALNRPMRRRVEGESRLDQLVAYLAAHSDVRVLDLREPLRRGKSWERLYAVTDSHWNDCGAYLAYRRLVEALTPWFPQMRPLPLEAFEEVPVKSHGGDLAQMLGVAEQVPEVHLNLRPRQARKADSVEPGFRQPLPPLMQPLLMVQADPRLPRAVMFRDSFAGALVPFLSEHFQRICYEWQELYEFDTALIEREHPDVVIQEVVERKLALRFPPDCLAGIADPLGSPPSDQAAWLQR